MVIKNYPDGSYGELPISQCCKVWSEFWVESQYIFSYVEEILGNNSNRWAVRQTGVYHRHTSNGIGNLWIFLHPKPKSALQTRLEACARDWEERKGSFDDWELTHILVLSSYFDDWRWYLKNLSADVERMVS